MQRSNNIYNQVTEKELRQTSINLSNVRKSSRVRKERASKDTAELIVKAKTQPHTYNPIAALFVNVD